VIASLFGAVIGIAIRRSASGPSSSSEEPAGVVAAGVADAGPPDTTMPVAPVDAGPADVRVAMAPADASPLLVPGDAPPLLPVHVSARVRNPVAEEHLRNAEVAFRDGNRLRQLAEADLALRADPRSVRAKFLLGDALIKDGDLDRGCAYLHALKRIQMAQDRARAAGCPGD
jgi:hypothetical protein